MDTFNIPDLKRKFITKKMVKDTFNSLKNKKLEQIELDLEEESFKILNELSKKYNTTLEVIINVVLKNLIVGLEKNKELKKGNFQNVLDTYEFIELLKKEIQIDEPILIIDFNNVDNKVVAVSAKEYEYLKSFD